MCVYVCVLVYATSFLLSVNNNSALTTVLLVAFMYPLRYFHNNGTAQTRNLPSHSQSLDLIG
jgi:hypothetical protein